MPRLQTRHAVAAAQGFAGGSPPDVFYMSTDQLAAYASNGSLEPYAADLANADDFFPTLQEAFTFEDDQFLVARVTDGQQQRMVRCSPALVATTPGRSTSTAPGPPSASS